MELLESNALSTSSKTGGALGASVSGTGGVVVVGNGWAGAGGVTQILGRYPYDGSCARIFEEVGSMAREGAASSGDAAGGWAGATREFW